MTNELHNFPHEKTFKATHNLTYPVNVGRNLARDTSLTHFVLASDIELFPCLNFIDSFFETIRKNPESILDGKKLEKVIVVNLFFSIFLFEFFQRFCAPYF